MWVRCIFSCVRYPLLWISLTIAIAAAQIVRTAILYTIFFAFVRAIRCLGEIIGNEWGIHCYIVSGVVGIQHRPLHFLFADSVK